MAPHNTDFCTHMGIRGKFGQVIYLPGIMTFSSNRWIFIQCFSVTLQGLFSRNQWCWVHMVCLWQLQENLTNFTPSFPVSTLQFCLDRKGKRDYFSLLTDEDQAVRIAHCQSNCADVQNRICWFLSNSVWKFIDSYCLKESYEVILASSASSQVNTQTVKGRLVYSFICLQEVQEIWSFLHFLRKGSKKITISVAHNESKGVYWERFHLMSLVDGRFGSVLKSLYFIHFIDMKSMTQSHLCSLKMSSYTFQKMVHFTSGCQ